MASEMCVEMESCALSRHPMSPILNEYDDTDIHSVTIWIDEELTDVFPFSSIMAMPLQISRQVNAHEYESTTRNSKIHSIALEQDETRSEPVVLFSRPTSCIFPPLSERVWPHAHPGFRNKNPFIPWKSIAEHVVPPISLASRSSVLSDTQSDCTSRSHSVAELSFNAENYTNITVISADNCQGNNTASCSAIKPNNGASLAPLINPGQRFIEINGSCSISPPYNDRRTIYDLALPPSDEKSRYSCIKSAALFENNDENDGVKSNCLPVFLTTESIPCDAAWGLLGNTKPHRHVSLESRRFDADSASRAVVLLSNATRVLGPPLTQTSRICVSNECEAGHSQLATQDAECMTEGFALLHELLNTPESPCSQQANIEPEKEPQLKLTHDFGCIFSGCIGPTNYHHPPPTPPLPSHTPLPPQPPPPSSNPPEVQAPPICSAEWKISLMRQRGKKPTGPLSCIQEQIRRSDLLKELRSGTVKLRSTKTVTNEANNNQTTEFIRKALPTEAPKTVGFHKLQKEEPRAAAMMACIGEMKLRKFSLRSTKKNYTM